MSEAPHRAPATARAATSAAPTTAGSGGPTKRGRGRPPVSDEGTARLVAYVPSPVKAELEHEAARLEVPAGELVREAIEAHLPRVRRRAAKPETT